MLLFRYYINNRNNLVEIKKGNYHNTLLELKKLEKNTNNFLVYWYLGHTHFKLHEYSEAIKYVKKSIDLNSKDPLNLNFLGELYLQINRIDIIRIFFIVLNFCS